MSSFKIIIPETKHTVFVNARRDEPVIQHIINLSKTHKAIEEPVFFDDEKTYTTVWMELLEVSSTPRFLDGSQVLDHETCTMIEKCIRDHESVYENDGDGGLVNIDRVNGGKDDEECEICVICQEELGTGDDCLAECGHMFHEECIQEWLLMDNVCPVCRKTLLSSEYMI